MKLKTNNQHIKQYVTHEFPKKYDEAFSPKGAFSNISFAFSTESLKICGAPQQLEQGKTHFCGPK